MNKYVNEIIELSKKSLITKDVPIGAIIVQNNNIIGIGWNTREKDQNILGHAEINAILSASKKVNNWNLSGCEMYVTLKPCSMCEQIIKQCRIDKVYYLLDKPERKHEWTHTSFHQLDCKDDNDKYCEILSTFFKDLREK